MSCDNYYEELSKRERQVFEELEATLLNVCVPNRSKKEYREQHKDQMIEYFRQYREQHKDELREKNEHYREQHKDELNAKKSKQIMCECDIQYTGTHCHKARHFKTKRHQKYLQFLDN